MPCWCACVKSEISSAINSKCFVKETILFWGITQRVDDISVFKKVYPLSRKSKMFSFAGLYAFFISSLIWKREKNSTKAVFFTVKVLSLYQKLWPWLHFCGAEWCISLKSILQLAIHLKKISFKEISLFVAPGSLSRCIYWAIGRRLSYVRKIISSELHILLTTAVFCDATALAYILETMSPVSLSRCNANESFRVDVSGSWFHLYSWNSQY